MPRQKKEAVPKAGSAVTQIEFQAMLSEAQSAAEAEPNQGRRSKSLLAIEALLDLLKKPGWPADGDSPPFRFGSQDFRNVFASDVCQVPLHYKDLGNRLSAIRRVLEQTSETLNKTLVCRFLSKKRWKHYEIRWGERKSTGAARPAFFEHDVQPLVHLIFNPFVNYFHDDYRSGVESAAQMLGVKVKASSIPQAWSQCDSDIECMKQMIDSLQTDSKDNLVAFIVSLSSRDRCLPAIRRAAARGVYVLTSGYVSSVVKVDQAKVGAELAGYVRDLRSSERWPEEHLVLVLRHARRGGGSPEGLRATNFCGELLDSDVNFEIFDIVPSDEWKADLRKRLEVVSATRRPIILVTFSTIHSEQVMEILETLDSIGMSKNPVRLISGDVSVHALRLMREDGSPLVAICGAIPFYLGQFALRAALRGAQYLRLRNSGLKPHSQKKVDPVLITAAEMRNRAFTTLHDFADAIPSLKLSDRAWEPWMR